MVDLERINFLSRKSRTEGLTDKEKEEQKLLRQQYIDSVVGSLRCQLENTYIVDEKGNKKKVQRKTDKN
ncbi:MAG: DUF896 domain-containing protein [Clostridiales bacterium]|nr:DUF896 domain-containing protein [Clostridiales bacterium]